MATVAAGANYALNMDTLDINARVESRYYNMVDSHTSGTAIRFWHDANTADADTTGSQLNYTRYSGVGLHTSAGTIDKVHVVSNAEDELVIKDFIMARGTLFFHAAADGGTQEIFKAILTGNDAVTGSKLNDVLNGLGGSDALSGKKGNDVLTGGSEADTFVFDTATNRLTNVDTITDFSAEDTILLDDAVFTAAGPVGTLAAGALADWDAPDQADDRIIYRHIDSIDADTAKDAVELYYDATGGSTKDAVLFATLTNRASVPTYDDFVIG